MKQADTTMSLRSAVEARDQRAVQRLPLALPGQFIINGRGLPCLVLNLSRTGAIISVAGDLLDEDQYVAARLRIDGLRLFDVRIRWRSANGIGLSFEKGRLSDAEIAEVSSTD